MASPTTPEMQALAYEMFKQALKDGSLARLSQIPFASPDMAQMLDDMGIEPARPWFIGFDVARKKSFQQEFTISDKHVVKEPRRLPSCRYCGEELFLSNVRLGFCNADHAAAYRARYE
jgi:hypothetical protein